FARRHVHMGRPKGATKLLVEDFLALSVRDLARAGVFTRSIGTPCTCTWNDAGVELHKINCYLGGSFGSGLFLRIAGSQVGQGAHVSQTIQLETPQRSYGGNKFLFLCPGKHGHCPCGRRVRKLYRIEERWLCRNCEPLASVATILADTGMRPEECYRLRWEFVTWVNGRHGTLMVTHGNTAAARRVLPMTPRVRAILQSRWEAAGKPLEGYVWPVPSKSGHLEPSNLKKQHARALKDSKVRTFVLYSLRHTFLTRLGASGCDVWTLARIAGHSSVAISARYVHPSEDSVLAAVEKLGGHKNGHSEQSQEIESESQRQLTG